MSPLRLLGALALAVAVAAGCGQESPPAPAGGGTSGPPVAAVAPPPASPGGPAGGQPAGGAGRGHPIGDTGRGRQVYMAQCVACHNSDPAKPGPVGPPVRGASPELLTAKVLHGTYPGGYKPQRDSKMMPPRPELAPSIPDLAVYLQ